MRLHRPGYAALILVLALISGPPPVCAQTEGSAPGEPDHSATEIVLTVPIGDYSISGLVTHSPRAKAFKYGVALFPGYPSILRLREEAGQPRFDLGGNFLIRSRRHWLDDETLVISVDAPSDQWASFSRQFRQDPRYGADVAALLAEAGRRYAVSDWTLVGTSEGTVSAFHIARMNPGLAKRLILTASLFLGGGKGPGLSGVDWDVMTSRLLWVHHESDPCAYTPYRSALKFAEISRSPLLTVRGGGPSRGAPCEARSAHGFVGLERETVLAMRSWIRTGVTPADVSGE